MAMKRVWEFGNVTVDVHQETQLYQHGGIVACTKALSTLVELKPN